MGVLPGRAACSEEMMIPAVTKWPVVKGGEFLSDRKMMMK